MATRILSHSTFTTKQYFSSLFFRSYASLPSPSSISRLRPMAALAVNFSRLSPAPMTIRCFATRQTTSSLNDSNPNWSNRPPKETILLDGCDFEHWLIVMEKPEGDPTRDEIIDSYIKTLATVVGSEQEARMKIYSVSTRHYYAFGALISEELSYKMKELEKVRWVLPDSYLDVKNKDYGGEPFINGQAVPYDNKYHEEWLRNNARANERNRRNDRPRNFDRSRNFERRRENMQQQNQQGPGPNNMGAAPSGMGVPENLGGGTPGMGGGAPGMGGGAPGMGGGPPFMGRPQNMGGGPPNTGGMQHNNLGNPPPNMGQQIQNGNYGGPPSSYMRGPQPTMGGMAPNDMGAVPPNNIGNFQPRNIPNNQGFSHQSGPGPNVDYQNSYPPPNGGYQSQDMPGRDMPPSNYQ